MPVRPVVSPRPCPASGPGLPSRATAACLALAATFVIALGPGALAAPQAEAAAPPTIPECYGWDLAYATVTDNWLVWGIVIVIGLTWALMPFGRRSWVLAHPTRRAAIAAVVTWVALCLLLVAWPQVIGLDSGLFRGVPEAYRGCANLQFSAVGLVWGRVGPGVAALVQWPLVLALAAASAFCGLVLSLLLHAVLRRYVGLSPRVGRIES